MSAIDKLHELSGEPDNRRWWWWKKTGSRYVPTIFRALDEQEQQHIVRWFRETERASLIGESSVPFLSMLVALIDGSRITRVVELGHYAGLSTLLLGFTLRRMGAKRGLIAFDVCHQAAAFLNRYVSECGLNEYVRTILQSSWDQSSQHIACDHLGGQPEMIVLDSSHEYRQTVEELRLWWPALKPGGLLVMHDTSQMAEEFDRTAEGGVRRAFRESNLPGRAISLAETGSCVYGDGAGIAIVEKPPC